MGSSDVFLIVGIFVLFIGIGAILPFLSEEAITANSLCTSGNDISKCYATNPSAYETAGTILKIFLSVLSMFLWTFGAIPIWLDMFLFMPLRIMLVILIIRNFPQIEAFGFKIGGSGGG